MPGCCIHEKTFKRQLMQHPGGGAVADLLVPFFLSYQLNTILTIRGFFREDSFGGSLGIGIDQ